ncbi:MAG: Gfo/Idh/MocA family oxidoreductase [Bacilli bacterium]|nr:Gfo/Idh/MocA family oxidoreductase [Bacilli bacterium]
MKTAIIGTGNIGHVHAEALNKLGFSIDAVCDISDEAMRDFTCPKYKDYKEMLQKEEIDIVHICTPHYLHFEMAKYCLENNINVIIEKPVGIKEEELDELIALEKKSKALAGVCFQTRYNHAMKFTKAYLEEHEPEAGYATLLWNRDMAYYNSAPWRGKWATEGGGLLINQAIHTIDFLVWSLGAPKTIAANVSNLVHPLIEVEDNAIVMGRGERPFTLLASTGASSNYLNQVAIKTKDGHTIRIVGESVFVDDKIQKVKKEEYFYGKACYGRGHEYMFDDFYSCVEEGKPYFLNIEEASKANRVVLKSYKSKGKEIEF